MSKIYRTAMGKPLDMTALRQKNEKVRAVGNMAVNARGDTIDSNDEVIQDNTKRVNSLYSKTIQNPGALASRRRFSHPTPQETANTQSPATPVTPDEEYIDEFGDDDLRPDSEKQ